MPEMHELNRLVICLLYAAFGVMRRVKSTRRACDYRFRRPALLTLSTARRGCAQSLRLSSGIVSDSFFESDTTASEAVGSVVYDEISSSAFVQGIVQGSVLLLHYRTQQI